MARKLKTYVTTSGFYDLAVAAPSMKAALEIWGSKNNLFHQGFAKETDDPQIVAATMAKPGLVLRRAVGTKAIFQEEAELPKLTALQKAFNHPLEPAPRKSSKTKKANKADAGADRKAAQLYDLAEKRREREEARAAAEEKKDSDRRKRAVERARGALDEARAAHEKRVADINEDREGLDRRAQKEDTRWHAERRRLEAALDGAQE